MKYYVPLRLGVLIGVAACLVGCVSQPQDPACEALLSLPWEQFDQTPNSGWRTLAFTDRGARRDYRAAADLIEIYLSQHQELKAQQRAVSRFHVGQLLALDGRTKAGVANMKQALVPENTPDLPADWNPAAWNVMVSATIAFLTGDRATLVHLNEQPGCPANLLEHFGQRYGHFR
jgi:hypothetical protein